MRRARRRSLQLNALLALLLLGGVAAPAATWALSFGDVVVESEVGAGANEAMIVLDWQSGTSPSHAWLFRWDGAASHLDAYAAIDAAEGADFSWSGGSFVSFVDYADADGDDHQTTNSGWLSFWSSGDGESWTTLAVGIGDALLVDGGWAGGNANLAVNDWPGVAPVAPLPEPATAALLGLAMAGIGAAHRRRLG